jgi:hypothetical protein
MSPGERHTIPLVSPRVFDFSGVSDGDTVTLVVTRRIWVGLHDEAALVVRLHAVNITNGSVAVVAVADGSTLEEPTLFFANVVRTVTFDKGFIQPGVQHVILPPIGARLLLRVVGTGPPPGDSCVAKLSVDLVLKGGVGDCADPGAYRGLRS